MPSCNLNPLLLQSTRKIRNEGKVVGKYERKQKQKKRETKKKEKQKKKKENKQRHIKKKGTI